MPRIEIDIPATLPFRCELDVLIGHINSGNHLGNDAVIGLLNEARFRFLAHCGYQRGASESVKLINADLAVSYKSEAHYGERIAIEVGISEYLKYGADFVYRITELASGRLIAVAKTAMLLFDYDNKKLVPASAEFHRCLQQGCRQ
jgi:acyl-CoA thioester hydrolase